METQQSEDVNGRDDLLSDLKNVVNNPEASDVVFKCSDGVSVHASRWLLVQRCRVFKSMLSNGMLETKATEIPLVKFPSTAMLSIFEFLHTGEIESYPPANWRMGFELLSAAHFFNISKVETIAKRFLWNEVLNKVIRGGRVHQSVTMDMLSVAVEFKEEWEGKDASMRYLVKKIGHDWFRDRCFNMLSRNAVEFLLRVRHPSGLFREPSYESTKTDGSFLDEYFKFRLIVLWLVYQVLSPNDANADAVREHLPGEDSPLLWRTLVGTSDIDSYLSELSTSADAWDSTAVLNSLAQCSVCKNSLEALLRYVTLSRIPSKLLLGIIRPLQIFPRQQLLTALLEGGLNRPVHCSHKDWYSFSLRSATPELIIRSRDHIWVKAMNMAVLCLPERRSRDACEWSFRILRTKKQIVDFGVIFEPVGQPLQLEEILGRELDEFPSSRLLRIGQLKGNTLISRKEPEHEGKNSEDEEENADNGHEDFENGAENSESGEEHSENEGENSENEETSEDEEDECKGWEIFDTELDFNAEVRFTLNSSKKRLRVSFNDREAIWDDLPEGNYYPAVHFDRCSDAEVRFELLGGFN